MNVALPGRSRLMPWVLVLLGSLSLQACAEGERRGLFQRRAAAEASEDGDSSGMHSEFGGRASCAESAQKFNRLIDGPMAGRFKGPAPDLKDVAYGDLPRQRLDVFLPKGGEKPAPVIVMVHGGGWCVGDKAMASVTGGKQAHWVRKGFVFVSVNYPMVADGSRAVQQAESVAKAVAYVQRHAGEWGGDGQRVVLVGHSAGAHLVSLVNADAPLRAAQGVKPVLGVVSLDSGATNVVVQMAKGIPAMKGRYLEAFGSTEAEWVKASPYHLLDRSAAPWLGVCGSTRPDKPCDQARDYADKSNALGVKAAVLPLAKKHGAMNKDLGEDGEYTGAVDRFIAGLDPALQARLGR